MKTRPRLKPVDLITYVALLTLIVTTLTARTPHVQMLLLKYGGLACILTLLWRFDNGQFRIVGLMHMFYPLIFIPIIFDSFAELLPWASPIDLDPMLIEWDLALLGTHPTVWLERFLHPWLTEIMTWAYTAYYFLPPVLAVALYYRRNVADFDRAIFGVVLGFYLSYIGYFVVPAVGPRFTLAHLQGTELSGILVADRIRETLDVLERFKQDAFPSGHTAVVLLVLFYAWKLVRSLFWVFLPVVILLIISTVYLRYHYVVDVIAGVLVAVLSIGVEGVVARFWHGPAAGRDGSGGPFASSGKQIEEDALWPHGRADRK